MLICPRSFLVTPQYRQPFVKVFLFIAVVPQKLQERTSEFQAVFVGRKSLGKYAAAFVDQFCKAGPPAPPPAATPNSALLEPAHKLAGPWVKCVTIRP